MYRILVFIFITICAISGQSLDSLNFKNLKMDISKIQQGNYLSGIELKQAADNAIAGIFIGTAGAIVSSILINNDKGTPGIVVGISSGIISLLLELSAWNHIKTSSGYMCPGSTTF
ncbi:MAG: hypothetical protein A2293_16080 [Elusimicrobia bacterium RIFOXYB2_FULL_49_7]|nr:MAG: hypothetical protein A2293_16080 [Elusimicrobia bacterium RIFOXYB2_FULL_49_7]